MGKSSSRNTTAEKWPQECQQASRFPEIKTLKNSFHSNHNSSKEMMDTTLTDDWLWQNNLLLPILITWLTWMNECCERSETKWQIRAQPIYQQEDKELMTTTLTRTHEWQPASWSKVSARCSGGLAWKRALVVFAPPKFGHRRRIACGSCRAAKSYCVMFDGCRSTEGAEERPWHKHKRQQTTTCCLGREGFSPTPCCQRRSSAAVSVDKEKSTGFDLTGNEWDASDRQTSELLFLCFLSSALSDTTAYSNEPLRSLNAETFVRRRGPTENENENRSDKTSAQPKGSRALKL